MRLTPGMLILAWSFFGVESDCLAYPGFIGYGYSNCVSCHFNPYGNGPLTDYGRGVAASEIAARPIYASKRTTDEDLSSQAGFLGSKELPSWIRPALSYRGMQMVTGVGTSQSLSQWLNMQAEGSLTVRNTKETFVASGTFGYVPVPQTKKSQTNISTWISREHYVGVRLNKELGAYAGLMDTVFGIRVADHNAYLRSKTFIDKNDQSHGLLIHYGGRKMDLGLHVLAGNLFQKESLRQKGASLMGEFDVGKDWRVGASALYTRGTFRSRQMFAVHTRVGVAEGSSVLAQFGTIREDPVIQGAPLGGYSFFQWTNRLIRGLNLLATLEWYAADFSKTGPRSYRAGPSLQWFPMQRLELRADLLGTRQTGSDSLETDFYTLLAQVHVWL
ncbi:MAG: hypothetical protein JNL01_12935 [Bdellovibrionales bacterium]|nr:hypothetical protein [Bdellovibrionales bacterium]